MAAVLGVTLCAGPAPADVTFNNVADTNTIAPGHGPFTRFIGASVSGGNIAFSGYYGGGEGLYIGRVDATGAVKIVDTDDAAPGHGNFTFLTSPSISGPNVAFHGRYGDGEFIDRGIYTATVGATGAAKIVDQGDVAPGHGLFIDFAGVSISGSNVAFYGWFGTDHAGKGIYTGTVGTTGAAKVVDTGDTAPGHGAFTDFDPRPAISGSNIAFRGTYNGGEGIYTGAVGATGATKVADTGDTAPGHGSFIAFGNSPSLSGSTIAFSATYRGGEGIYTATVGGTEAYKVVDTSDIAPGHGAFTGFGTDGIAVNGSHGVPSVSEGDVVFLGNYSGGAGIYFVSGGAGGSLLPVLNTGDSLFGSTVTALRTFGGENGNIEFGYDLADGRSGIGVATVPEPASASLCVLALGGLALSARARRLQRHR